MDNLIYKILRRAEFEKARKEGVFQGSPVDHADGFIHFSTAGQMRETAAKHFAGQNDLVLLVIDSLKLPPSQLRWEPARAGALFPHLYGPLDMTLVSRIHDLGLGPDGHHIFPPETLKP